jgi:hypothetical protein
MQTVTRLGAMPTQDARPGAPGRAGSHDARSDRRTATTGRAVGGVNADGLPRRVRRTNLAPQLRGTASAPPAAKEPVLRSPDEVRAAMSALQRGTERGRREAGAATEGLVRAMACPPASVILSASSGTDVLSGEGSGAGGPSGGDSTVAETPGVAIAASDASPLTERGSNDSGRNG